MFAQWKVNEPQPDFAERITERVKTALRARCRAARDEAVELPDGGFNPKMCNTPGTGACQAKTVRERSRAMVAAGPSSGVRPALRVIRGGKAAMPEPDDEDGCPVEPVA